MRIWVRAGYSDNAVYTQAREKSSLIQSLYSKKLDGHFFFWNFNAKSEPFVVGTETAQNFMNRMFGDYHQNVIYLSIIKRDVTTYRTQDVFLQDEDGNISYNYW